MKELHHADRVMQNNIYLNVPVKGLSQISNVRR